MDVLDYAVCINASKLGSNGPVNAWRSEAICFWFLAPDKKTAAQNEERKRFK